LAQFSKNFILEVLPSKIVIKLSKYGFGIPDPRSKIQDPGSGKILFRIPDPGVKKAPDPGFLIPDPNPQHWS
jgi:hypothetical protein